MIATDFLKTFKPLETLEGVDVWKFLNNKYFPGLDFRNLNLDSQLPLIVEVFYKQKYESQRVLEYAVVLYDNVPFMFAIRAGLHGENAYKVVINEEVYFETMQDMLLTHKIPENDLVNPNKHSERLSRLL